MHHGHLVAGSDERPTQALQRDAVAAVAVRRVERREHAEAQWRGHAAASVSAASADRALAASATRCGSSVASNLIAEPNDASSPGATKMPPPSSSCGRGLSLVA